MSEPKPTLRTPAQEAGWAAAAADPGKATLSRIAAAAGVSTGTAAKWLRLWRVELGDELFRTERAVAAAEDNAVARQAAEAAWADLRAREARNLGVTASQIRQRLLELLPVVASTRVDRGPDGAAAPVVVYGPDARQVKALADAIGKLLEVAELLDNRPTRHSRRSVPSDQWTPALGAGPTPAEKLATVLDLAAAIRQRSAS